jgi:hypothetical protein
MMFRKVPKIFFEEWQHMKKLTVIGLAAGGLMLAACAGPIPAWQDPNSPLQVSVSDATLQSEIRVTALKPERTATGQLRVTLNVFNTTNADLRVDYMYWFTDAGGRQVEAPLTRGDTLPPHGYKPLMIESLSAVDDFRVQLRPWQ